MAGCVLRCAREPTVTRAGLFRVAYLFARHARPETCWPTDSLAHMTGLAGNRSRLWVTVERLDRFGVARFVSTDTLTIRLWLPALTARQLARLPEAMAAAYSAGVQVPS